MAISHVEDHPQCAQSADKECQDYAEEDQPAIARCHLLNQFESIGAGGHDENTRVGGKHIG